YLSPTAWRVALAARSVLACAKWTGPYLASALDHWSIPPGWPRAIILLVLFALVFVAQHVIRLPRIRRLQRAPDFEGPALDGDCTDFIDGPERRWPALPRLDEGRVPNRAEGWKSLATNRTTASLGRLSLSVHFAAFGAATGLSRYRLTRLTRRGFGSIS